MEEENTQEAGDESKIFLEQWVVTWAARIQMQMLVR
jgi:hypothetical protein